MKEVRSALGPGFTVKDKYMQNETVYRMMRIEKVVIFMILLFIIIVVSCNVFGSLTMLIIEKRDDIATLQHLGARPALIRRIFFDEGWMIILLGAVIGLAVGIRQLRSRVLPRRHQARRHPHHPRRHRPHRPFHHRSPHPPHPFENFLKIFHFPCNKNRATCIYVIVVAEGCLFFYALLDSYTEKAGQERISRPAFQLPVTARAYLSAASSFSISSMAVSS